MLHGCDMQAENIGKSLIQGSQFNEIAEANDIVIIYPQNKDVFLDDLQNTMGCWDYVGYTKQGTYGASTYLSKEGEQTKYLYSLY